MPKTVKKHNQYGDARKKTLRIKKGSKRSSSKTPADPERATKIKSAAELGLKADSMGIKKKPKSKKI